MSKMIEIEIDGRTVETPGDATIIEAADAAGIYIPRFCYHHKLSIAANCRMCLVEVEKMGKPLPACATPISPGMKVWTKSKLAIGAQRTVMEFLLINHPLDCPICDQGGECELQDVSMGYGEGYSHYEEPKRSVIKEDLGPLIDTGMTRCIHCTRCVRFGEEVAGLRELGATGRGEQMQIGTYVKHFMKSEVSGNVIDLCPVGALTSKPYRYQGRSWEMQEHEMVAPHDCLGSNVYVHTRGHQYAKTRTVMRVVPKRVPEINECWLSDADRFSYEALHHKERVWQPMIKRNGQWNKVTWQQILPELADRLKLSVSADAKGQYGLAGLISPQSTTEEMYLFARLLRALGASSIDYRYRQTDFSDDEQLPAVPPSAAALLDVENSKKIFLLGVDICRQVPLLALRVRAASLQENADADVVSLGSVDYKTTFDLAANITVPCRQWEYYLQQILHQLLNDKSSADSQSNAASAIKIKGKLPEVGEDAKNMATYLQQEGEGVLLLGLDVLRHRHAARIRHLAVLIAQLSGCQLICLSEGANSSGAAIAGCLPHRIEGGKPAKNRGFDAQKMFANPHAAYWLHGLEVELDCAHPQRVMAALEKAECVICCHSYFSPQMLEYADIILPKAPWSETAGTFVNLLGNWQSFRAASIPHYSNRPGWKIIQVLARLLGFEDFDFQHSSQVLTHLKEKINAAGVADETENTGKNRYSYLFDQPYEAPSDGVAPNKVSTNASPSMKAMTSLCRFAHWPIYAADSMLRRAGALSEVFVENEQVSVNQKTADALQLKVGEMLQVAQGDDSLQLPLAIDERLADKTVMLPSGVSFTQGFGEVMADISLRRAEDV